MVPENVVGQGHVRGAVCDVDEAVGAGLERAVIDPHVGGAEHGDAVTLRLRRRRCRLCRPTVAYGEPMDDDVAHVAQHEAGAAVADHHAGAAAVDGLVGGDDQVLLRPDGHVARECDPQRLLLDDAVAERARRRARRVGVVAGVGHHVGLAVLAAGGAAAEADRAVRQALPVVGPAGVAAPAVVHRIAAAAFAYHPSPVQRRHVHAASVLSRGHDQRIKAHYILYFDRVKI